MSILPILLGSLLLVSGCLKMQPGEVVYAGNTLGNRLQIDMQWDNSCYVNEGALWCAGDSQGIGVAPSYYYQGIPQRVIASGVEAVRLGYQFGCALVNGDELYCWGENSYGQVGDGTTVDKQTPVRIFAGGVQSFAVGGNHACAVVSGVLKCWGRNSSYQLGDGTTTSQSAPKTIITSGVAKVFAGDRTTCASVSSVLKCWGENSENEVGTGSGTDVQTPTTVLNKSVSEMQIGYYNSCALTGSSVYCWGRYYASTTPALFLQGVSDLSRGDDFVCAIQSGDLKCWGWHHYYLVDDNDPWDDNDWQELTTIATDVDQVAAGGGGLCYIRGNSVYCGGEDYTGTLFRGSSGGYANTFEAVFSQALVQLKSFYRLTCALTAAGQLSCTGGSSSYNLFGTSPAEVLRTFTPVVSGVSDYALTNYYGCYVISGSLQCAGYNSQTFGDGVTTNSATLRTVVASGVTRVAGSQNNVCYIEGGAMNCWGSGGQGILGQGDTVSHTTPVQVIASGVTRIALNSLNACAVVSNDLYCWGYNASGHVGIGTTTTRETTPQLVLSGGVTEVTMGGSHTCALQGGAVKCWGYNNKGQVGIAATTTYQTTPHTVISSGATDLGESAGRGNQSCAIVASQLYCWGIESNELVGTFAPTLIATEGTPEFVAQSDSGLCYHNSVGVTYCRGYDGDGALGTTHGQTRFTLGLWDVSL